MFLLLTDPTVAQVGDGHPLDSHSGLGLSAFSCSLVLVVCGMLAANVISGQVDHALGCTHSDMGTPRIHSPLLRATRVQTLALSSTLMPGMAVHHDLLHRHGGTDVRRHGPPPGTPRLPPHPRRVPAPAPVTGVIRSILYYGAQDDARLPRGWVILGLGLAVACLFGFGVTRFYDRKGLHRNPADKEPQPVLARTQTDDP